jgi:uncharacterized membrane protein YgdD (TMEM256/DUF423 family)
MHRNYLIIAALFGATGVALGAFGAHGLQQVTTDEKILHGYHTGVEYQLYHALALVGVTLVYERFANKWIRWSGKLFIAGILCFSGSLYLITLLKIEGSAAIRFAGPVTPLGGVLLIAGWLCLFAGVMKRKGS